MIARRSKDIAGAAAIPQQGEGGRELRARQRRGEAGESGVGEIAQIAHHRATVARQHIDSIGDPIGLVLVDLVHIDHRIAQMVERLIEGPLGHGEFVFARAGQEVRDEGVQPQIVRSIRRPEAEDAVARLPRQQALDGVLDTLVKPGIDGQRFGCGELVDIEQGHGPADDLLGTAIGIAVQRLQQGWRIDGAEACHGQIHRARPRHEIRQQIAREGEAAAGRYVANAAPVKLGGARIDIEPEALRRHEAGAAQGQINPRRADAARHHGNAHLRLAARSQFHGLAQGAGGDGHRALKIKIELIVPRRRLHIGDLQMQPRLVAQRKEARQGRLHHHGIAHDDIAGRLAHPAL